MHLHPKAFRYIAGTTDTEHAGALFVGTAQWFPFPFVCLFGLCLFTGPTDMLPRKNLQQDAPDTEANYTLHVRSISFCVLEETLTRLRRNLLRQWSIP